MISREVGPRGIQSVARTYGPAFAYGVARDFAPPVYHAMKRKWNAYWTAPASKRRKASGPSRRGGYAVSGRFQSSRRGGRVFRKKYRSFRRRRGFKKYRGGSGYRSYRKLRRMINNVVDNRTVNRWRDITSGHVGANANECGYHQFQFLGVSEIEDAIDSTLHQANQAAVPTESAIDNTDISLVSNKRVKILKAKTVVEFRNNDTQPGVLEVYWFGCMDDTVSGNTPLDERGENLVNEEAGSTKLTDVKYGVMDGIAGIKSWKFLKKRKFLLNTGDSCQLEFNRRKPFMYNAKDANQESFTMLKGISQVMVIRVQGVVARDSNNIAEVGYNSVDLSYVGRQYLKFCSAVDTNYKFYREGAGELDTFTNADVVGQAEAEVV